MRILMLSMIVLALGALLAPDEATVQEARLPRVGMLLLGGPGARYDGLRQDFAKLGYVEGKNVVFGPRFGRGQFDRTPALAAELVAANVDVIVAVGAIAVDGAREGTAKIPIVFAAVLDPVALGYAASLQRPGGNITGIISFGHAHRRRPGSVQRATLASWTGPAASDRPRRDAIGLRSWPSRSPSRSPRGPVPCTRPSSGPDYEVLPSLPQASKGRLQSAPDSRPSTTVQRSALRTSTAVHAEDRLRGMLNVPRREIGKT